MARYYIKPNFWNTNGYRGPSGVKGRSGLPAERGYGHEEWNNADFMAFEERGNIFRVFHTEGLGNAPVEEENGQSFLFLIRWKAKISWRCWEGNKPYTT